MPNYLEVPWWPFQISLKLCDCDPCPMKWKSWKFELLTIYRSQDIAIQRLNLFQKIAPYRNFLFLVPLSESNNSFKWCDIKLFFSEVIWDQAYFTKKKKKKKKKFKIILFSQEMAAILFLKKNNFFSNFKRPKIKNRLFLWIHTWFS